MIKVGSAELLAALWPALILFGVGLVIVATVKRGGAAVRMGVMAISAALLLRYVFWRATSTLPQTGFTLDFTVGVIFLFIELTGLLAAVLSPLFLCRTRDRSGDVEKNKAWLAAQVEKPLIDLFICSYNEEEAILERTIIGATGMDYPNYRVWMLDDGGRPWLCALCEKLNCGYIARPDNSHAKAGNINHALKKVAELPNPRLRHQGVDHSRGCRFLRHQFRCVVGDALCDDSSFLFEPVCEGLREGERRKRGQGGSSPTVPIGLGAIPPAARSVATRRSGLAGRAFRLKLGAPWRKKLCESIGSASRLNGRCVRAGRWRAGGEKGHPGFARSWREDAGRFAGRRRCC